MTKAELIFNPVSEEFFSDPFDIYRRMRDEAPIYYNEAEDFYAITRHADVAAAFKDHESFSSARGADLSQVRAGSPPFSAILFMDPPEHRHMRGLINKAFTPRAIQSQKDAVTQLVEHYLSQVNADEFDVVQDFSGPFPVDFITQMAGVPQELRQQVRHWMDVALHREPGQLAVTEEGIQAFADTVMFFHSLSQERRKDLREDMISRLIAAEVPGEHGETHKLDDLEIAGFASLLGGAGAETVTKLLGIAVVTFARNPGEWQKLLDDRSKVPAAVEELLRYEGPVQYNVRYTLKEAHLPSGRIPAGKPVFLCGAAANRDPRAFADADVFDIDRDRTEAQNLGLGYGIHSCLGAALARMESAIALDHLLDFMPRYEVQWDGLRRVHMQNVSGYSHVPVKVLR